MAENFGSDGTTQGAILVSTGSTQTGEITITDSDGNVLASYTPQKEYSSVVISCAGIEDGGTYTVTTGDTETEVTMDGLVYGSGSQMGMGGQQRPGQSSGNN